MPEIVPLEEIDRPEGSPVAEKVYGPPAPPVPVNVTGTIAIPLMALIATHVAVGATLTMTVQLELFDVPFVSLTVTVYVEVPLTVGVPEMVPPEEIDRPAGRPVALNV